MELMGERVGERATRRVGELEEKRLTVDGARRWEEWGRGKWEK